MLIHIYNTKPIVSTQTGEENSKRDIKLNRTVIEHLEEGC